VKPYLMRCVAMADGRPCLWSNHYLRSFDPEAAHGMGHAVWTPSPARALAFPTPEAAWELWHAVPRSHPVRASDGKPNKPLTAFTIEILRAP
jgi:hypothetical protein